MFTFRAELAHAHLFQNTVLTDPFSDSHTAVSRINVSDIKHVEMSSIYDEDTDGQI
jgi:hypothetical protein